ncbi:MAG: hypothetical protein JWO03_3438 [Bacteroidetes bacterium]|nr:hypothetical protein [Bacteroidota bacterium]
MGVPFIEIGVLHEHKFEAFLAHEPVGVDSARFCVKDKYLPEVIIEPDACIPAHLHASLEHQVETIF